MLTIIAVEEITVEEMTVAEVTWVVVVVISDEFQVVELETH